MVIYAYNNFSTIADYSELPKIQKDLIYKTLSYKVPGAEFSKAYRKRHWDGRKSCIKGNGNFPSGLLGYLTEAFKKEKISYKIANLMSKPERTHYWQWIGPERRYYQNEVVSKILEENFFRGIYELSTRAGKTVIAASIIQALGVKSLVVLNTVESMYQTAEEFQTFLEGVKIGFWGSGKKIDGEVIFALMGTLRNSPEILDSVDCFIIDEVHLSAAETWYETLLKSKAYYRFGQSGTAFREDNADIRMFANTGRIFYRKTSKELWTEDYILKPKVNWLDSKVQPLHPSINYAMAYKHGITHNQERNNLIGKLVKKHENSQVLISVEHIDHANNIRGVLKVNGIDCRVLHAQLTQEERDKNFTEFKEGKFLVAIATKILNTSVTIPNLAVLINAAGKMSGVALLQKIGRVLGKGNKKQVFIYDFIDKHHRILYKHSQKRYSKLNQVGYEQNGFE